MTLSFDGDRDETDKTCERCGTSYRLVRGFILDDGSAHAVYFAACHTHDDVREAWIDVILGTFGEDTDGNHVTFGCRVGPVVGQDEPAATAIDAACPYSDKPLWGVKLTREAALQHPWLSVFWNVVDFILVNDPAVEHHVYHHA
ncbi:MAG: hypothetical protein ABIM89_10135 [Mycobacteriales bacterium]